MSTITDASFNAQLQAIEGLIASRDLAPAAAQLTALGRAAPEHPVVYILGMRLAEAAGNAPAALKSAERAVACAPAWPGAVIELAALLARQDQQDAALVRAAEAAGLAAQDATVLSRAVDIAHHFRNYAVALPWLEQITELDPDNRSIQQLIGRNLALQRRFGEARQRFETLLALDPADAGIRSDRMSAAFELGDLPTAQADADWLVAQEPGNENYRFWQQRVHGQTPSMQPAAMISKLFDGYANTFDMHLVRGLKYDTPKHVAEIVRSKHPTLKINLLDLGCGTGLLGVYLGRPQGALIGVDLSEKMVEQAARHNLYDRFHLVDVKDALAATPAALYEVITACDVFVYVGDLSTAIPDAFRVLKPGGDFIFSCEAAEEDGPAFVLRDSMRYAHKASDIEAQCRAAGFGSVVLEKSDLRLERGVPIGGFYVVATRPGGPAVATSASA